jgi:hypothetical protein
MGLFDLFRRSAPRPDPQPQPVPAPAAGYRRVRNDPSQAGDPARGAALAELFAVPREHRDAAWLDRFWQNAWTASLAGVEPSVADGPDGFPYLRLHLPSNGAGGGSGCLMNVAAGAIDQGAGAALFSRPGLDMADADYVMPMGVLDSLLRFGCPEGDPADLEEIRQRSPTGAGPTTLAVGEQILVATPSADYLPPAAARALHRHLVEDWGLADPRIALLVSPSLCPSRSLVIGVAHLDLAAKGATEAQIAGWMQRIGWFLPPSRGLMLMPDGWSAAELTALRALF